MDEGITKVFTKYDTIRDRISIPSPNSLKPIWRSDDSDIPVGYIAVPLIYQRFAINQGLEGVLFIYYARV